MFAEIADGAEDLIVLHDALDFGHCHLGLGIPMGGRYADINSLDDLRVSDPPILPPSLSWPRRWLSS